VLGAPWRLPGEEKGHTVPGLLGIVNGRDGSGVAQGFGAVLRAMERGPRLRSETCVDAAGRWALGRVHLGVLQPAPQLSDDPVRVLFHGDLHNEADLASVVERSGQPRPTDDASLVGALYRQCGAALAGRLKGVFCAAILDEGARQLLLISDRLGSYPIYWFNTPDRLTFASELRAVLRDHPRPAVDPRTVNDIVTLGFPFGDKTLAAGVQLLPSSSTLVYRWDEGTVSVEAYASLADSFRPSGIDKQEYFKKLRSAFDTAMERAVDGPHRYGLSLSGGLDTRVILSALDRRGVPVSTFTLGGKGCADEVIANRLSQMARTEHRFVELGDRYLGDLVPSLRRMVSLTDGMYVSHGFTETLALQAFEESDFSVLLRGHGGELAKASTAWPFHTDAQTYGMKSPEQFVPHLLARLDSLYHGGSAAGLFAKPWADVFADGNARRSLEQSVADVQLSPPDLCTYLYLHEYHRRVTVPSLEIFRHIVDVRMPLADFDFIECVFQGPSSWRDGTEIHRALIAGNDRRYLGVRNPNTGAPAGAGPVREAVLDKLNSLLRRLNVYGYRHYHNFFDGSMRHAFLEGVEQVLLSPDTLARGVVRQPALRTLIDEARRGAVAHDHVLQVLTIVELWQRENL
jgi:asparagine synthase (glutamine-hydrolysing)